MKKRILIISHNEICYNPRLLKAADYLFEQGCELTVFNPITGIASEEVYNSTIESRKWNLLEYNISKRNIKAKINWLICSLINGLSRILYNIFNLRIFSLYYLNKGLWGLKRKHIKNYDYVLIHLIDSLPYAVSIKKKYGSKVIYDSQEYFRGQYSTAPIHVKRWVYEMEEKYISQIDILLATTNAMKKKIVSEYKLSRPSYRVRNVPAKNQVAYSKPKKTSKNISLIWHGMTIYFNNRRGLTLILEALSKVNRDFDFYIQGNITENEKIQFDILTDKFHLQNKVHLLPAAHPDKIVESLALYDIGISAEIPEEDNQRLTSSNKLFDYIHAGLAVICPDVEGLLETVNEYNCGLSFKQGDKIELTKKIEFLIDNQEALIKYKMNSLTAAKSGLFWSDDYEPVLKELIKF